MKKTAYLFTIAAMAFALGSCTDDEPAYNAAPAVDQLPVFFSYEDKTELEIFENTESVDVPVYRKSADGELTLPVTVTVTPDADGFTFPASVTFADGEKEARYTMSLDMSKIKGRVDYNVTMSIADGVVTPYYTDKVTYTLNYAPWELVTGTDKDGNEVTKALYRDDIIAPAYGLDPVEYEVEMQANPENTNIIRLVDPYGEAWPYLPAGAYDTESHHYMYFNTTNPNAVFLCDKDGVALGAGGSDFYFHTGLTLDADGEILITSYYNYYVFNDREPSAEMMATLSKGNLTYGQDKLLFSFVNDSEGSLYYGNRNSLFRVIWPGAEPYVDPATVWTEIGTGKFTDGILYPIALMEADETELPDYATYDVTIMQFGGDPNMYRIMNPWKSGVCPYGVDYNGDKYIELDTTNPNCVFMPQQSTGLTFSNSGTLYIMNYAYYLAGKEGMSENDIIAAGLNDTYKDGVIYSAPGHLLWGFAVNGQISLREGEFAWQVVMPGAPAEPTAKNAPASRHFNGNGPLALTSRAKQAKSWASNEPVFKSCAKSL